MHAFDQVHQIILKRNILIKHELDRIGPDVADRIERLKLAIKHEQDEVGPAAEKALTRSFLISVIASALVITFGIAAAAFSGAGITRPLRKLSETAAAMEKGDLQKSIDIDRKDEIGILAQSLATMRDSILEKVTSLETENAERQRIEKELAETHNNLEKIVEERTEELAEARDTAENTTRQKPNSSLR